MVTTFNEYLKENDPYPEYIPMALRSTIEDWFGNREIEDKHFPIFFKRVIDRDYNRYKELLRIEPGVARFDWLVDKYTELQSTKDGYNNENITDNGTTLVTLDGTTVRTDNLNERISGTNELGGSDNVNSIDGGTTNTATTGNRTANGETINASDATNRMVELEKITPMSISYTGAGKLSLPSTNSSEVGLSVNKQPNLNWEAPSGQKETIKKDGERATSNIENNENTTGNELTTHGKTVNAETVYGKTETTDSTTTNTGTTTNKKDDTTSTVDNRNKTVKNESGQLERQIKTGRNDSVAHLLNQAVYYIKNTNAWYWFKDQLEVCFIGVYDLEEY